VKRRAFTTLLVAVAFFAGLSVERVARAARRDAPSYRPLDVFAEVLASVENNYVEEVKEKDLVYGAVDGLMAQLDPHSVFMRPEVYREMMEETTGEFDGVGLDLTIRGDQLTVISPLPDSPAERAGILPGDRILEIDGTPTRDQTLLEASRRLRGAPGTKIVLRILREGFAEPQQLTMLRGHIRSRSVEWRLLDRERGFAYVRLKGFQDRTDASLRRALDEARAQLGREIRGLVLDLRNNPGGLLEQAVLVADRFLREGTIVVTEGRNGANRVVETAKEKGTEPPYPMIVLVNRGSASASEVVAGALQDNGRAVIMGTRTFGKGSVQTVLRLVDGSGLKLTNARYYTPKHRSIQERGIAPDVAVPEAAPPAAPRGQDEIGERDLKRHLKNESPAAPAEAPAAAEDHQLRTALDYLRASAILKAQAGQGK
jgi:carboxyl-terminal processing protease